MPAICGWFDIAYYIYLIPDGCHKISTDEPASIPGFSGQLLLDSKMVMGGGVFTITVKELELANADNVEIAAIDDINHTGAFRALPIRSVRQAKPDRSCGMKGPAVKIL